MRTLTTTDLLDHVDAETAPEWFTDVITRLVHVETAMAGVLAQMRTPDIAEDVLTVNSHWLRQAVEKNAAAEAGVEIIRILGQGLGIVGSGAVTAEWDDVRAYLTARAARAIQSHFQAGRSAPEYAAAMLVWADVLVAAQQVWAA